MDALLRLMDRVRATTRVPVPTLLEHGCSVEADAAVLRRRFHAWISLLTDPDTADDLTLAVYEALANVVDHAYGHEGVPGPMMLRAEVTDAAPTTVTVTVTDHGAWRTGTDPGTRGRGLALVRGLTTEASVLSSPAGTTVRMRHVLPAAS